MKAGRSLILLATICLAMEAFAQPEPETNSEPTRKFDPTRILTQRLHDDAFGRYESGPVQAEWLSDGRKMRLLTEVRYVAPDGTRWAAPSSWIVDGASIPQACWSIVGGPYEGKYREASVLHDYACDKKLATSQAAARMFYNAMRCSRVPKAKAKAMFYAVYHFGPQWGRRSSAEPTGGGVPAGGSAPEPRSLSVEEMRRLEKMMENNDPSLAELEVQTGARP